MNVEFHSHIRQAQDRVRQLHLEAQNQRELKAAFSQGRTEVPSLLSRVLRRRRTQTRLNTHSA